MHKGLRHSLVSKSDWTELNWTDGTTFENTEDQKSKRWKGQLSCPLLFMTVSISNHAAEHEAPLIVVHPLQLIFHRCDATRPPPAVLRLMYPVSLHLYFCLPRYRFLSHTCINIAVFISFLVLNSSFLGAPTGPQHRTLMLSETNKTNLLGM